MHNVTHIHRSRIQLATAEPEKCYIDLLTQDVLSQIMYFLDPLDVFQCVRVCKQFKLAAQHGSMSLPKVRMGDLVTTVLPGIPIYLIYNNLQNTRHQKQMCFIVYLNVSQSIVI